MRTFTCFTSAPNTEVPTLSLVMARTLDRARELARRELMDVQDAIAVEIVENGQLMDVLFSDQVHA